MEKSLKNYDVLIIGAGPAGANAAISYKNLNPKLTVGLVDKAIFPRDKSLIFGSRLLWVFCWLRKLLN